MNYKAKLAEIGIVESRQDDLVKAMDVLHAALSKLDNQQLAVYSRVFGVIGHLDMYARHEGLRNIATDMLDQGIRRAVKRIDFDEFPDFSDKLYYMAEAAMEVEIPGAKMLCKSLCKLRAMYESRKCFFGRLGRQAVNIEQVSGHLGIYALEIRHTSKYIDSCKHLDDSTRIGSATFLRTVARKVDNDNNDSGNDLIFVRTNLDTIYITDEDIKKALKNTFSHQGCSHEYDCCGCISTSVSRMKRLYHDPEEGDVWVMARHWNRNV